MMDEIEYPDYYSKEAQRKYAQETLACFEATHPMKSWEKRALRNWVASGHSVYDNPGSRYVPELLARQDFLTVYRFDKSLDKYLKGTTRREQEDFLKEHLGYKLPREELDLVNDHMSYLEHEISLMWDYLKTKGFAEECRQYMTGEVFFSAPIE